MRTHRTHCITRTTDVFDFVDVTDDVQTALDSCGIRQGHVIVFTTGPGNVLIVNEKESGLLEDIRATLGRLVRRDMTDRRSLMGSTSVVLPAVDGRLRLGMWQRVLLVELESPDTREVVVQIVGE